MSKFLSKLSIITLVLTLAVSFVGCGGGGGGGNGDDSSKIEGYWYIEKVEYKGQVKEYPVEKKEENGTTTQEESIIGLVKNKMYRYTKETTYDLSGEKMTEQITYDPDRVAQYSIKENKVSYKSSVETGTMTFAITGDSATIVNVNNGETYTLSARRVKASAVEGAVPEGPGDPGDLPGGPTSPRGVWKINSILYGDPERKKEEYPDDQNLSQYGFSGEATKHLYYSFDDQGHHEYHRYTDYVNVVGFPCEEGVYYNWEEISDICSFDGYTVTYPVTYEEVFGTVTLEFDVTGNEVVITRTSDLNSYRDTINATWVGSSVDVRDKPSN